MPPTRVAVCISGKPGPLVEASHQRHWNAALAPLRRDPGVLLLDIFLHLHGSMHARSALEAAAAALQARSLRTYEQVDQTVAVERYPPLDSVHTDRTSKLLSRYFAERHSSVNPVPCMPVQCLEVDGMECIATGYDQSIKWRGCLHDIRAQERRANSWRYDYVLRARPDLEFGHALPDAAQWRRLRSDVVMPMIVTRCAPRAVKRPAANVSRDVCFVDDTLALMPRHAADAYFGIATEYEGCIPRETMQRHPCLGRWLWPECRVFNALWRLNLSFTEFPPTQLNWALLGLTGSSASPRIERRKGVATVWGGPRFPTHEVASSILEPSNFARTPCAHRPRTQNATSRYSDGAPDGLNC